MSSSPYHHRDVVAATSKTLNCLVIHWYDKDAILYRGVGLAPGGLGCSLYPKSR